MAGVIEGDGKGMARECWAQEQDELYSGPEMLVIKMNGKSRI